MVVFRRKAFESSRQNYGVVMRLEVSLKSERKEAWENDSILANRLGHKHPDR
jgi:hypothetical protein